MPPPQSDFDREMRALESEIKRLEAEYHMFFAGRLPRLPWERRARVEMLVKTFDRAERRNTADLFRFQTMQARFVKFLELWERQLREREEGSRTKGGRSRTSTGRAPVPASRGVESPNEPPAPGAAAEEPRAPLKRPDSPVALPRPPALEHVVNFQQANADRVKELYEKVAEARRAVGEAPLAYHRVAALVTAQLKKRKAGDADVAFKVAVKDGKVSLSVKTGDDKD